MKFLAAGLVLWFAALGSACTDGTNDEAEELIAHTRNTTATYSVYNWNVISLPNAPVIEEWSAEFHDGSLHRVETPRDRIIADCAAVNGFYLNLETGERLSGPSVAKAACGIQANSRILESQVVGSTQTTFGPVKTIKIRDTESIRTYTVAANGALVAATTDDLDARRLIKVDAMTMEQSVPSGIFTEDSLMRSAVVEKYRSLIRVR